MSSLIWQHRGHQGLPGPDGTDHPHPFRLLHYHEPAGGQGGPPRRLSREVPRQVCGKGDSTYLCFGHGWAK